MSIDPVDLTRALTRVPSVTPDDGSCLIMLADVLAGYGFQCRRADRGRTANLYARYGTEGPVFAFAGHTDVVPPGDAGLWSHDPFAAVIEDGNLFGRGTADMKSAVAAFVSAAAEFVAAQPFVGSIVLIITGDEEGDAVDGTPALIDWMAEKGETIDLCLVGEPSSQKALGDRMKVGRRGSLTVDFTARGTQGHAAYPERAKNPIPPLARLIDDLAHWRLDEGSEHFDPSTLSVTTFDVGNPAVNVIPAEARARANIRFNDVHEAEVLLAEIERRASAASAESGVTIEVAHRISGRPFLTPPGPLTAMVAAAVEAETGRMPKLSTSGGTSDARFLRALCPVVEFGLVGATIHQTDEHVAVEDIRALARIYRGVLERCFLEPGVRL